MKEEEPIKGLPKIWYEKKIKRLENKARRLKKEREDMRDRFREYYQFWIDFRRFYNRFTGRKYDSDWPIVRVDEALMHLKEKEP